MRPSRLEWGPGNVVNQKSLQAWVEANCPTLWSLLKEKAKRHLPSGIVEYISPPSTEKQRQLAQAYPGFGPLYFYEVGREETETGRLNLQAAEKHLLALISICGLRVVEDAYRRDLSGVATETRLAELLCEIALCASLSKLSPTPPRLKPPSGKGTYCDVSVQLEGFTVYGEAKRYEDTWFFNLDPARPESRSLVKGPPDDKPYESSRPRAMDLSSKLEDVPRQFPQGTLNVLFIFHQSPGGKSPNYIQQALFGDSTFFVEPDEVTLRPDGLFTTEEWKAVSGCSLTQVSTHGALLLPATWGNPNADVPIPEAVHFALGRLSMGN